MNAASQIALIATIASLVWRVALAGAAGFAMVGAWLSGIVRRRA